MKRAFWVIFCFLLCGCGVLQNKSEPSIEFSVIPPEDAGGTIRLATIEGRVFNARPDQQIVLYARSGNWYIQPFTDQPFTKIEADSKWRNTTHLGTEYAALLVNRALFRRTKRVFCRIRMKQSRQLQSSKARRNFGKLGGFG